MSWHLDLDFPGANACGAAVAVIDGAPAISVTPDPREGPEALWFHLKLRRLEPSAPAPWLLVRHVGSLLGGNDGSALQPVVRCEDGPWGRLPPGRHLPLPDGHGDVCWPLPAAAAAMEIAFCIPYAQPELDRLIADTGWRVQALGASERGRPLLRIDNGPGAVGSTRAGLFLISRQHSGETPGSWVLDGLVRRLAELGDAAPLTWVIPFGDPDGVAAGSYGKDRHPVDYNRAWPGEDSQPRRHETMCWVQDFHRWRKRCAPLLALDLHAPGASERCGTYAFTAISVDGLVPPPVAAWAERLRQGLGAPWAAEQDFARIGRYPGRWPRSSHLTASRWFVEQGVPALALESSYQGQGARAFLIDDYRATGARLADTICAAARG